MNAYRLARAPEADTDLGEPGVEHTTRKIGGDDFDLLDRLETHLVLGACVAERWSRAEPCRERSLGPRIHDIRRRVEVDALDLVDLAIPFDQRLDEGRRFVACQSGNRVADRRLPLPRFDRNPIAGPLARGRCRGVSLNRHRQIVASPTAYVQPSAALRSAMA